MAEMHTTRLRRRRQLSTTIQHGDIVRIGIGTITFLGGMWLDDTQCLELYQRFIDRHSGQTSAFDQPTGITNRALAEGTMHVEAR